MAHVITTQKIVDGDKITVVKYNIKGDAGTAAELVDATLFDASAFKTGSVYNKIMEIEYCLNGFSAELFWDATSAVPIMSLAKDRPTKSEFWDIGGLVNNGAAANVTGDINITTKGLISSTNDGYIIFYILERKVRKFTTT